MQCFRLPEAVCADIDRLAAGFWWGDKAEGRKLHWAKWSGVCRPKDRGGLGFRDIRSFNKALLAKQVWRMMTNPQSLVARVFKARYFRNGDLMEAGINSNASYIWRSLVWGRSIVVEGRGCRVGDGKDISVWRDRWVVGLSSPLGDFSEHGGLEDMRVSELIKEGSAWDEAKIEAMFCPAVKECILNTPIGEKGHGDEAWWRHDPKENFSVKSAYLLEVGYYTQHPNMSEPDRKTWSRLVWNASVPPKVKLFMWRAFSDFIPTAANLMLHHVPSEGICELCGDRWGNTEHCLLHCPKIAKVWKESRFWGIVKRAQGLRLLDVADAVFKEWGDVDYELWVMMVWQVWGVVCKLMHPNGERIEFISEDLCVMLWEEFQLAKPTAQAATKLGVHLGEKIWQKPKKGRFRVDVDARFSPATGSFGVGVAVRDENGALVVALSKTTPPSSSAMMAEVMAVVRGVVLCVEHGVAPFEIFTDSFFAARVMADPEEESSLLPDDICDIMRTARENGLIGVFHMYRSANRIAHSLAKSAFQPSGFADRMLDC